MKIWRLALAVLAIASVPARAHERGFHGGVQHPYQHFEHFEHRFVGPRVFIGPDPFWYPLYPGTYPYPYYPPPVVVEPSPPQVYVQPEPAPETNSYWYYCEDPPGYYPYVPQCPRGWMQVAPGTNPPQ